MISNHLSKSLLNVSKVSSQAKFSAEVTIKEAGLSSEFLDEFHKQIKPQLERDTDSNIAVTLLKQSDTNKPMAIVSRKKQMGFLMVVKEDGKDFVQKIKNAIDNLKRFKGLPVNGHKF